MTDQNDDVAIARSHKRRKVAFANPLLGEIAAALLASGGSAHRDAVIDKIALNRGAPSASDGLRREVLEAFELHCDYAEKEALASVFHLPFGPFSRRWALTHEAFDLLHDERRARTG